MEVLGQGVSLTNAETFALLRRQRDLRQAKNLPAFGEHFTASLNSSSQTAAAFSQHSSSHGQSTASSIKEKMSVPEMEVRTLYYLKRCLAFDDDGASSITTGKDHEEGGPDTVELGKRKRATFPLVTSVYSLKHINSEQKRMTQTDDNASAKTLAGGTGACSSPAAAAAEFHPLSTPLRGTASHVRAMYDELYLIEKGFRETQDGLVRQLEDLAVPLDELLAAMTGEEGGHPSQQQQQQQQHEATSGHLKVRLALKSLEIVTLINHRPTADYAVYTILPDLDTRASAAALEFLGHQKQRQQRISLDDTSAFGAMFSSKIRNIFAHC